MKKLLFLLLVTGVLFSCSNKKEEERREADDMLINSYFEENNIEAEPIGDSGVYFRVTEEGDNDELPTANSIVRVFYKGYLLEDESVFDQRVEGENDYLETHLANVVFGWQVGIPKFSKGAKGQLFIPSHAGYGNTARPGIPEHSVLVFDIHLVNFF